ncbi:MAG: hypothetical protein ACLTC1_05830 [Turicibacter sp.]
MLLELKSFKRKGFTMPVIFDDGRLSSSFQITSYQQHICLIVMGMYTAL